MLVRRQGYNPNVYGDPYSRGLGCLGCGMGGVSTYFPLMIAAVVAFYVWKKKI